MKKEVLNLVFYLVCFIVLLLFAAMFFNWKSLEGFREGADEVAAATASGTTTDSTAAATTTAATTTAATTSDTTAATSTPATTGNTSVSTVDTTVPASSTSTSGTAYVSSDTTGNTNGTAATVAATSAPTITTNPSCDTIIGDDKLGVYLKPKKDHVYPIVYTTSPDIRTLANFTLENGKHIQSIDDGKNTKVYFAPTTAVVGGMAYGTFCSEDHSAKSKLPITYTSNTLQVRYDKTDYYIVFVNDSGKYVAAMKRIGDSSLSPNMIRSICQTLK